MRAAWGCPAIAAWLSLLCGSASATESDGQLWATGRINHPIGERWALSFMAQGRFADDISESDAWLVRPAVGYRLSDSVWLGAGYDYFRLVDRGYESRFWQEVAFSLRFRGLVMGNRLRIEQRWFDGDSDIVARARYRLRCAHPIASTPTYLVFSNEVFVNLNDHGEGPRQGFEQNRLAGGLGLHLGPHLRAELGYQWRHLERPGADRNDHILAINLFFDTRGKSRTVPSREEAHH